MATPRDRRGFLIAGRVQGVGFRWWTRQTALRLGLTGTVRNLPDGRVEVLASGDPAALNGFRKLLEHGPPGAEVQRLQDVPAPPDLPDDFLITR